MLAGIEGYDEGSIVYKNDLRVGYLRQRPVYPAGLTVLEACFHETNDTLQLIREYEQCLETPGTPGLDALLDRMEHADAWNYEQRAKQILSSLHITDYNQKVDTLSGGQLKRVALANVLIGNPDMLILDEPTNHLDLPLIEWLEDYLTRSTATLLMVTHDRYFLDNVCNEIIEIDDCTVYSYKGNYSYYLEKREERIEARNTEIVRANNLYRTEIISVLNKATAKPATPNIHTIIRISLTLFLISKSYSMIDAALIIHVSAEENKAETSARHKRIVYG